MVLRSPSVAVALCLPALAASAQDEGALSAALVGRYVTVKIDMPASHKGVDLRFDREVAFDVDENASRIRDYDVALREGQRAPVTRVKVKDDLIEFHLAGGGFNWGTQTTTRTFSYSSKTSREIDLEKQIRNETDRDRRRRLEYELDDLRRERERRDERRRREIEEYNLWASERDHQRALRSGSRFNLRFRKDVPPDALTPGGVLDYLARFVDPSGATPTRETSEREPGEGDEGLGWLRPGLVRQEVEDRLGRPLRQAGCRAGDPGLTCEIVTYDGGEDEIEATYVEDVLVRYSVRRP